MAYPLLTAVAALLLLHGADALAMARPAARRGAPARCTRSRVAMVAPAIRSVDICAADVQALAVFYETCFGMERSKGAGCVEMGFPGDPMRLRLLESPGADFRVGEGFDAVALYLPDVRTAVDCVEVRGGQVLTPPEECTVGPSKIPDEPIGTKHVTFEALVSDPQGYRFRLIQRAEGARRVAKLVYRVTDLEKSQQFYSELLGMSVLRWRSNLQSTPLDISLTMQLGDPAVLNGATVLEAEGNVPGQPVLEFIYYFNMRKLDVGSAGAGRLTLAAAGASELATRAPSANGKLVDAVAEGGALVQDPDGFEVRLVAN